MFHVAPDQVTHEMRRQAKAVNFGIVYGISAFSLSQDIGVSVAEAKAYMEAYFATFPRRPDVYGRHCGEGQEQGGYVETLFHRRRDLPELKSSNFTLCALLRGASGPEHAHPGHGGGYHEAGHGGGCRKRLRRNGRRPVWCCKSTTS